MTGLQAHVGIALAGFDLDVRLDVRPGRITAVLGPNGAGKTTLLQAIAGLRAVDHGRIVVDDTVVDDPEADVFLAPAQRRVGMVFQDLLLFPHLSVRANVEFGPRSLGRRDARAHADAWLHRLGLTELADRRPSGLSGGQAQRVAMARALATDPDVLLLDEPLAALDVSTRVEIRRELRTYLGSFTGSTVIVTHDPLDALVLAEDVVILEGGRVTQSGSTPDVARRPATSYVAALMGVNLLHAHARDGMALCSDGATITIADAGLAGPVVVVIRPEAISLHRSPPEGSARNVWPVTVGEIEPRLDRALVHVSGPPDLVVAVTPSSARALELAPGARLWASAKALDLDAYSRPG